MPDGIRVLEVSLLKAAREPLVARPRAELVVGKPEWREDAEMSASLFLQDIKN